MINSDLKCPPSWSHLLAGEFEKPYMHALQKYLRDEVLCGQIIYPTHDLIFNALNTTPPETVSVVILGQDPYHGNNQAHGLAFSVCGGVPIPPSLKNIYKELSAEYNVPPPQSGDLTHWATQGVLLLNATLTVRANTAGSHQNKGWELFTDAVIHALAAQNQPIVFMLWGAYAQKKMALINNTQHLILTAPHPSPLSAHRGFIGCGHFKTANEFLKQHNRTEIKWV